MIKQEERLHGCHLQYRLTVITQFLIQKTQKETFRLLSVSQTPLKSLIFEILSPFEFERRRETRGADRHRGAERKETSGLEVAF